MSQKPRLSVDLSEIYANHPIDLGIMLGYFANWGTSLHISNSTSKQWVDATILHIVFAGIILIMSLFALESPRWLAKVGRDEDAALNMSKLRNLPSDHPYVQAELIDIHDQIEREREATLGSGFFGPLKELFVLPSNRYRILLGLGCQLLGRMSPLSPLLSPLSPLPIPSHH